MAGRAGYHTVGKIKKIQEENRALSEVFAKFDLSGDGTISIAEYRTLCQARAGYSNMRMGDIGEYGVQLTESDIRAVRKIADDCGEVHKADFILHIKQYNLLKDFKIADPESEFHWKKKADLAFRIFDKDGDGFVSKKEFKWMTANKRISQRKVDIMFERCDLNKDGRLDYSEFKMLIYRNRERKEPLQGGEKTTQTSRRKSLKTQELQHT